VATRLTRPVRYNWLVTLTATAKGGEHRWDRPSRRSASTKLRPVAVSCLSPPVSWRAQISYDALETHRGTWMSRGLTATVVPKTLLRQFSQRESANVHSWTRTRPSLKTNSCHPPVCNVHRLRAGICRGAAHADTCATLECRERTQRARACDLSSAARVRPPAAMCGRQRTRT
jgi:hypothetical protein